MVISYIQKGQKRAGGKQGRCIGQIFEIERERKCAFSLDFRSIGPSVFDEARRKVVLRGEGNAWAPVSWSFDKLCEVGVLSYLFYLLFKCFVMLVLV